MRLNVTLLFAVTRLRSLILGHFYVQDVFFLLSRIRICLFLMIFLLFLDGEVRLA